MLSTETVVLGEGKLSAVSMEAERARAPPATGPARCDLFHPTPHSSGAVEDMLLVEGDGVSATT